jgi:hypothetical protein
MSTWKNARLRGATDATHASSPSNAPDRVRYTRTQEIGLHFSDARAVGRRSDDQRPQSSLLIAHLAVTVHDAPNVRVLVGLD